MLTLLNNHARFWLWLSLLCCAAALALWSNSPYDIDDAPITYRYAEHLAAGQGFTYNEGEYILGTSTPLYTLILAAVQKSGIAIPLASNIINFVSSIAVVWVTMALTAELSGAVLAGAFAAGYLLLQGSFVRYMMAGMETPLYTLLIVGTFLTLVKGRTKSAACLAGLAFVMRLDGLAVGGALLLGLLIQHRKIPFTEALVYLCTILPWVLFAFWYFGSPIPLSMIAKQHHLQIGGESRYWIWDHLFITAFSAPRFLLPLALPGVMILYRQSRQLNYWLVPILWLSAYSAAYTIVGITFYEWYLMPVYPVLAIFVGAGIHVVFKTLAFPSPPARLQPVPFFVAGLVLLLWLIPYAQHMVISVSGYKDYLQEVEGGRVQAGQWLHSHTPPDSKIRTGAIGHVGYQSARYMIDSAALVTPLARILQLKPDYYMTDGYVPAKRECGALKHFATDEHSLHYFHTLVSGCNLPPVGTFADFTLANARFTTWALTTDGKWQRQPTLYLETQWLIDQPQPTATWTLFVHFTDAAGNTLFQLDHLLGLQSDRSVLPPAACDPTKRAYVYAEMPAEWAAATAKVTAIRVGLWDPTTQIHLPIAPGRSAVDNSGRLVITVRNGEIE